MIQLCVFLRKFISQKIFPMQKNIFRKIISAIVPKEQKNKAEAIALVKKYLKKHNIKKIYSTVDSSDAETITLNILLECNEKEKFFGFTVGEHTTVHRHKKTFKLKDGVIIESRDEFSEFEYEE